MLKKIRLALNLSVEEFATFVNVNKAIMARYENGTANPPVHLLQQICQKYNVNPSWLLSSTGDMFLTNKKPGNQQKSSSAIYFIDEDAQAGYIENLENGGPSDYEGQEVYRIPGYEDDNYRMFEIQGDSMMPALFSGDVVIVKLLEEITPRLNGKICVIVTRNGVVAKRPYLNQQKDKLLIIKSDNPDYKTYTCKKEDILEVWEVAGKITSNFNTSMVSADQRFKALEARISELEQELGNIRKK